MANGIEKNIEDIVVGDWVITHKGRARQVTAISGRFSKFEEQAVEIYAKGCSDPLVVSEDHTLAAVRGNETCFCGCKGKLPYNYRGVEWKRKYLQGHGGKGHPPSKLSIEATNEIRSSKELQDHLAAKFGVSQTTISRVRTKSECQDDPEIEDCSYGKLRWLDSRELSPREFLYFPKLEWAGKTKVDKEMASLLGYYLAEGSIIKTKIGKKHQWKNKKSKAILINGELYSVYGVQFTLNMDEKDTLAADIVDKLRYVLGDPKIIIKSQSYKKQNWLTVTVYHSNFANNMVQLAGYGSKNKAISKEVWSWDTEAIQELVASYALGDGHFDASGQQYVYSISRPLISQISTILFSLGVWHGHLYQDWQSKKGRIKKKNRYHRLYWDYRRYPQVLDLMRGRLRPHVKTIVQNVGECSQETDYWEDGFLRCLSEIRYVPAPFFFHDISVDEDESFIANRIVVHNCKTVLERILPSVQNNIINIVREKKVKKYKEEHEEYQKSDKLRNEQEEMKKRLELKKIRETKNKDIQKKLLDALREKEEAGKVKPVEEEEPGVVERDEVAVKAPIVTTPKKEDITQLEPEGEEDITGLLENEENRLLEEEHKKIKDEPHLHKGLPYEVEEEKAEHGHDVPSDEALMKVLKKEPEEDEDIQRRREQSRKRLKKLRDEKFQKWKRTRSSLEASLLDVVAGGSEDEL
jgi:hypothetical protein